MWCLPNSVNSGCGLFPTNPNSVNSGCGLFPTSPNSVNSRCGLFPTSPNSVNSGCGLFPTSPNSVNSGCGLFPAMLSVGVVSFSYHFVRLDGSMSIKKRAKIVEQFNNPAVSLIFISRVPDQHGVSQA